MLREVENLHWVSHVILYIKLNILWLADKPDEPAQCLTPPHTTFRLFIGLRVWRHFSCEVTWIPEVAKS